MQKCVDTLIVIPNQNLFRVANEQTTFADAFAMADQVLYSGVACITDLMVKEGLINLDFADVRSIMSEMGKAMMGTGEATGERRAVLAAEAAIANPLLDETSMKGARGLLISITGGNDLTLYEVDEAASRIRQEVDEEANIILGATFDAALDGVVRVSVVATGIDQAAIDKIEPVDAGAARSDVAVARRSAPAAGGDHARSAEPRAATAVHDEVEIRPSRSKPASYVEPSRPRRAKRSRSSEDFIPPAAEQPALRAPRMPQIEDLPPLAQNQLRAHRGEAPPARRRAGDAPPLAAGEARRLRHQPPRGGGRPALRAIAPPSAPPAAGAAERAPPCTPNTGVRRRARRRRDPPRAQLDPHGRVAPRPASLDDDQLEIPAFLRRQSELKESANSPSSTAAVRIAAVFRCAGAASRRANFAVKILLFRTEMKVDPECVTIVHER